MITFTEAQAIVSFCARFELSTPERPSLVENFRHTPVAVGVKLSGDDMGITGLLQNEEDNYAVVSYLCNQDSVPLQASEIVPKAQGGRIRVCIETDEFTAGFGAVMRSINSFNLERGDVLQRVVAPKSVVVDPLSTRMDCDPGQVVCSIDCSISNDFFYSDGFLTAAGVVELQYRFSGIRRLVQVPVTLPSMQFSPPLERKAIEAGGYIGERQFSVDVELNPSSETFVAEAFMCTKGNGRDNDPTPRRFGDTVRICVRPDSAARERGVYVRGINSFFFQTGNKVQFAVESGGTVAEDENTMLICSPGNSVCVFSTLLTEEFFEEDGEITGEGEVYLQFGRDGQPTLTSFRMRNLQITNSDAAFAGATTAEIVVPVSTEERVEEEEDFTENAKNWWVATPLWLKIVYMVAISVLLSIIASCCCGGYCSPKKRKKTTTTTTLVDEGSKAPVVVQVYVDGQSQDGLASGDSELRNSVSKSTRRSTGPMTTVRVPSSDNDSASTLGSREHTDYRGPVPRTPTSQRHSIATSTPKSSRRSVSGSTNATPIGRRKSTGMPTPQNSRRGIGNPTPQGSGRSIGTPGRGMGNRTPQGSRRSIGTPGRGMGNPTPQGSRRSIGTPGRRVSSKSPGRNRSGMERSRGQSMRDLSSRAPIEEGSMKRISKTPTGRKSGVSLSSAPNGSLDKRKSARTPGGRRASLVETGSTHSSARRPKQKPNSIGGLPDAPL